jgi:hypothetical protein
MVYLLLLIDLRAFLVLYKKKKKLACPRSVNFGWHVRLTLVVVMMPLPHHLIRLSILFLSGLHIFCGSARFDQNWLFSFFLFLLFLPKITRWPREKLYQLINLFIFFGFSPSSFIYNFLYLH